MARLQATKHDTAKSGFLAGATKNAKTRNQVACRPRKHENTKLALLEEVREKAQKGGIKCRLPRNSERGLNVHAEASFAAGR